jgi:hypothetical protein
MAKRRYRDGAVTRTTPREERGIGHAKDHVGDPDAADDGPDQYHLATAALVPKDALVTSATPPSQP